VRRFALVVALGFVVLAVRVSAAEAYVSVPWCVQAENAQVIGAPCAYDPEMHVFEPSPTVANEYTLTHDATEFTRDPADLQRILRGQVQNPDGTWQAATITRPAGVQVTVETEAEVVTKSLTGRILPYVSRVVPWVAGAITAYEVCDAFTQGCWLFARDDPPRPPDLSMATLDEDQMKNTVTKQGAWVDGCRGYPGGEDGCPDAFSIRGKLKKLRRHYVAMTNNWYPFGQAGDTCQAPQLLPEPFEFLPSTTPFECGVNDPTPISVLMGPEIYDLTEHTDIHPAIGDDPAIPNVTSPSVWPGNDAAARDDAAQALAEGDPTIGGHFVQMMAHAMDPENGPPDPYASVPVPSCSGVSYATCVGRLNDAGFINVTRHNAGLEDADLGKAADEVLSLSPPAGTSHDTDTEVEVHTNPAEADMPIVVPSFASAPGEDADAFTARLTDMGFSPEQTTTTLDFAPGAVEGTSPEPGTKLHRGDEVKVAVRTDPNNDCEDHGTNADPDDSRGWKPLTRAQFDDAPDPPQPFLDGQGNEVHLRWGATLQTSRIDKSTGRPVLWDGWGFRHIAAKHGWNADDIAQTQAALLLLPTPAGWAGGKYYWGPPRRVGSFVCVRKVVVDTNTFTMPDGSGELAKGIVTSYDIKLADATQGGDGE
jgi:hypothetical protein